MAGGRLQRTTPRSGPGPLQAWIGMAPRTTVPWMLSRPSEPLREGPLVIAIDGLHLDGFSPTAPLAQPR